MVDRQQPPQRGYPGFQSFLALKVDVYRKCMGAYTSSKKCWFVSTFFGGKMMCFFVYLMGFLKVSKVTD